MRFVIRAAMRKRAVVGRTVNHEASARLGFTARIDQHIENRVVLSRILFLRFLRLFAAMPLFARQGEWRNM